MMEYLEGVKRKHWKLRELLAQAEGTEVKSKRSRAYNPRDSGKWHL